MVARKRADAVCGLFAVRAKRIVQVAVETAFRFGNKRLLAGEQGKK